MPEALISFVLRMLAPFMFRQVTSMLQKSFVDADSKLAQRLQQRHHLYPVVRRRIRRFLDRQAAGTAPVVEATPSERGSNSGVICRTFGVKACQRRGGEK